MNLFIAGKNTIAVDVLRYSIENFDIDISVILNKTEDFQNGFQKSLGFHARLWNIPIVKLENVYDCENAIFISLEYDRIIKPNLFKSQRLFNIHFSLLPAYKGMYTSALPIIYGDKETGVTLHKIDKGIDTGDIIAQNKFEIKESYTARDLYFLYINFGTNLVIKELKNLLNDTYLCYPQSYIGSTYFGKKSINYSNLNIDFQSTALQLVRQFRAFSFREYQLPKYNNNKIGNWKITDQKSNIKPGLVVWFKNNQAQISTIDYDIIITYDLYDEVWNCCRINNFERLKHLLENNSFDLETRTVEGWTALIIAVFNGSYECVCLLINAGADVNAQNYNKTNVLMYAKSNFEISKNSNIIEKILINKANIFAKDIYGKTVLDWIREEKITSIFLDLFKKHL